MSFDVAPVPHEELFTEFVSDTLPVAVTLVALFFTVTVNVQGQVALATIDVTSIVPFGAGGVVIAAAVGAAVVKSSTGAAQAPVLTSWRRLTPGVREDGLLLVSTSVMTDPPGTRIR